MENMLYKDDDNCVFVYEIDSYKNAKLIYSNHLYNEINNISSIDIGDEVESILKPVERAYEFKKHVYYCLEKNETYRYMTAMTIKGKNYDFENFITPITYNNRRLVFGYAKIVNLYYISKTIFDGADDGVAILKYMNGVFAYDNCNRRFADMIGKSTFNFIKGGKYGILHNKAYECLNTMKAMNFKLTVNNDCEKQYYKINMIPFNLESTICIFCKLKNISDIMISNERTDDLLLEYNSLFNYSLYGTALLSNENDVIKIEKSNKKFDEFNELYNRIHSEKQKKIAEFVRNGFKSKKANKYQIQIKLNNGCLESYVIGLIPVIKNSQIIKAFITISNTDEKIKIKNKTGKKLTNREEEVLSLVAKGLTNKYIAYLLGVTEGTIKKIVSNGYAKLGIGSRVELVKFYLFDRQSDND